MIKQNPVITTNEIKEFETLIKQRSIGFEIDHDRFKVLLEKIKLNENIRQTTACLAGYNSYTHYLEMSN